ncbi:NUC185 domain-containing protein [Pelagophyceae sp. CCMP2097]|nr:NUC185 domain-containing protein [Pelagophyceae sp. CCMP2097]
MPDPPPPPAKTYPFELDGFQAKAVQYIEQDESVLVSAHTSAGKTVVAEYAIAKSLRDGQRVIYTSPIKALSNQKFRDLQEEFGDVGLMTGDITINAGAACLVMTTEILRSMLYRGSEVMREVKWVIYDEIHYMRDKERGVVWEESIIMLPHSVRFVFLSATIPNSKEFASWIAQTHRQPCHVVYTDYRPTPLVHYVFVAGGEGLHLVVDEHSNFRHDNFDKAMASVQADANAPADDANGKKAPKKRTAKSQQQEATDLQRIIKLIVEKEMDPAIIFAFSKAKCEANAVALKKADFNTPDERDVVLKVYESAMEALSDEDKELPQVRTLLPLLQRGVGIHHGGLLPIVKEVVEILFQEGLIKVLFATETFAIGINMPAKTVVFTECRKFDGQDFRWLTSGEYIQMSGRAGRRGKDAKGIVIQILDEKMEPAEAKRMLYGAADALNSSYHVTYNMLLNLLRVEGAEPDFLVRSSFHQYQQEAEAPALVLEADRLQGAADAIDLGDATDEAATRRHVDLRRELDRKRAECKAVEQKPLHLLPWLQPGRLVRVKAPRSWEPTAFEALVADDDDVLLGAAPAIDFGWGVVAAAPRKPRPGEAFSAADTAKNEDLQHVVDVVVRVVDEEAEAGDAPVALKPRPPGEGSATTMAVITVPFDALDALSAVRVFMPNDVRRPELRAKVGHSLGEVHKRFVASGDGVPLLDAVTDMKIADEAYERLRAQHAQLEARLAECPPASTAGDAVALCAKKDAFKQKAIVLRKAAREAQTLVLKDDLKRMRRVLRRLGHVTPEGVIALKGRAACELNTADELVVAELLLDGAFGALEPPVIVAMLSCVVYGEKRKKDAKPMPLRPQLQAAHKKLTDAAKLVARALVDSKVPDITPDEFAEQFNPDMMEVLFSWANGAKFIDLTKLTDAFEGTLIRVIRRLDELLRQLASASFAIGNFELKSKFDVASVSIKRDIVFAASLYL